MGLKFSTHHTFPRETHTFSVTFYFLAKHEPDPETQQQLSKKINPQADYLL